MAQALRSTSGSGPIRRANHGNKLLVWGTSFAVIACSGAWYIPGRHAQAWNGSSITATYVGAQLRETKPGDATLFLAYALQNHSDVDYALADGPGVVLMSRLKPDGVLSSQEQIQLSYPTLVPARQRVRMALEIAHLLGSPAPNDGLFEDKLKELLTWLRGVQSFVLFDRANRFQLEFPGAWPDLELATGEHSLTRTLGPRIGRIVIDAGHGGHDSGTIGPGGLMEKNLCLDVALRLGKLIQQQVPSIKVLYTRQNDEFLTLEQRTEIANNAKAGLFLSIHANSSKNAEVGGFETYYLNFNASPRALDAYRENALHQSSIYDLNGLVEKIARQEKLAGSRDLAIDIQQSLATSVREGSRPERNRGVREAPFVVLSGGNMPSVLAEISFLSNPADEQWLMQPGNRQQVAEGLYRGIEKYLLNGENAASDLAPSSAFVITGETGQNR
jgi:N-acetylmuramoyl-L-alanine amidase